MSKSGQSNAALRIVERAPFFERDIEISDASSQHSLHDIVSFPSQPDTALVSHLIERYSKKGDLVLDPFCSAGSIALESALRARVVAACDLDDLAVSITSAKLSPADITEVTLALQKVSFRRPVVLDEYRRTFSAFYDLDTYREIANLKLALTKLADRGQSDRAMSFIELLALSLLHGHTAGYFSVYSSPQVALSLTEQEKLNYKRCQSPDYRAVMPRILRKSALSLRDGIPSAMRSNADLYRVVKSDASDLSFLGNTSVKLTLTELPMPDARPISKNQWLRNWFIGAEDSTSNMISDPSEWLIYMNQVLLELARVSASGARALFIIRHTAEDKDDVFNPERALIKMISSEMSRFWEAEGVFAEQRPFAKLKECLKERDRNRRVRQARVLVLKRR